MSESAAKLNGMQSVDQFHQWLLRLDKAGVPVRFTHSWRALADELSTARMAVGRIEDVDSATWEDLIAAGLSPSYSSCLIAWLKNPGVEQLETLVQTEVARHEHRRHTSVAWAGAAVLILVGVFAFLVAAILLLPRLRNIGNFVDFGSTGILAVFANLSSTNAFAILILVVVALASICIWSIGRAFKTPALELGIENALLAQAAQSDVRLDAASPVVRREVPCTDLQSWASREDESNPAWDSQWRRKFSRFGHEWILRRFNTRTFYRKPVVVGVLVGGALALAIGGLIFGAFTDLVIVLAGE